MVSEAPSRGKKWPMVTFSNIMKSRIHVNQSLSGEGAKFFYLFKIGLSEVSNKFCNTITFKIKTKMSFMCCNKNTLVQFEAGGPQE